jgi:inner membrane protein
MELPKTQNDRAFMSVNLKMLLIAQISLLLIIPLNYVQDLISERSQRQQTVVQETTSKWGKSVYVCGPILKVPYLDPISNSVEYAYFFPDDLKVSMAVNVLEPLKRGLYTSTVFQSKVNLTGRYNRLDFKQKNIAQDAIYWNRSSMILQTDNLQSLKNEIVVVTPTLKLIFEPQQNKQNKSQPYLESQLFDARLIAINTPFNLNLICNGSKQITIVPIGKITTVHLKTNWTTPKFVGYFLPSNKNITKQNTAAEWNILHFNRPFGQQSFQYLPNVKPYGFSVSLINPVDEYQQNDRALKRIFNYRFDFFNFLRNTNFIENKYSRISLRNDRYCSSTILYFTHSNYRAQQFCFCVCNISLFSCRSD